MKKRILAMVLCALMIVSSAPLTPLGFLPDAYAAGEAQINISDLKAVFDSIPEKSKWSSLYLDTTDLEGWYDDASSILGSPDSYTQASVDLTKNSLERAFKNLEYHTTGIALDKTSLTVVVGGTGELKAKLSPENAADAVTWKSSDTSIATVSSKGVVTAKAYSKSAVTITASSNGKSASCPVKTVNPIASVKLSASSKTIYDNEGIVLTASAVGKDSSAAVTNTVKYTWKTENEKVATVTSGGFVAGISKGTTKITVTATDGIATSKASCDITVKELIPVTGLKAETMTNNGVISLVVGESGTFKVTVTPETASKKTLKWESSDTSVASITASSVSGALCTATIKGLKKGTAKITYKTTDGSGKSGSFTVSVTPLVSAVSLSETVKVISVDDKIASLKASISPKDAGNQKLDWSTSNSAVCTVDRNGTLMPQANGTCVITATTTDNSNISVSCKIRVAPRATGVSLDSDALGLKTGQTCNLTATVKTTANSTYTGYVEWISDNPKVASVSESGKVTANYPGIAKIKAITLDGTEKVAVCTVSVVQPVEGISISETKTLGIGSTITLKPTFKPTYATNQKVTWSSGNTSVATVDSNGVVTGKSVGTCTITVKTADGGYTSKCTVSVIIPTTSVKLNKTSATINSGTTLNLSATVSPSNATDKTVKWKSSNTAVAKVSSSGVVTAVAGGTATITATASGGQTANCTLNVVQAIEGLTLSKTAKTLYVSQKWTLGKTVKPSTATVSSYKWSSSDKTVATVSSSGEITALKEGQTTITLKADNLSATCVITVVKKVSVTGVSLVKAEDVSVGQTVTLTANVKPSDASNKAVTWSTSDSKIATVTSKGVVKGVKEGTATITVKTSDGSYSAKCKVTVCPAVSGIRLTETKINVNVGKSYSLSATVFPTDAVNRDVIWSSSNTAVATVTQSGLVKGIANGKATITAKTADGGFKATCTVDVSILVSKITLNYESVKIQKGRTKQMIATIAPSNATNKKITWSSSDSSIASVSDSGQVLARSTGTVTITAKGANGKKATCKVTVIQYATKVELSYASVTVNAGKTKLLTAVVKPAATTNKKVVWSTSDKNVVKVDANGKLTAVNGGTAVVTATSADGKAKATCKVTVLQPVSKITLSKTKADVKINKTITLKATVGPKTATDKTMKWSSADKNIATVSSKGVVKGISKGTVKITAKNVEGTVKAVCTVTVQKAATGVSLNKTTMTILKGKKSSIAATVKPSDASVKTVTWSSNNYDVVDVDKNGNITAKSTGYAEVTAKTKDGGFKAVCRITVIQPAKGMVLETAKQTIDIGQKLTLKAKFTPKDATNTAIKWSTSDKSIVKVDINGVITGIKKGTATITAKSVDGGFVSKCTVTVVRKVKSVKLDQTSVILYLGKTATLKATVSPSDANDKSVTWSSADKSVVTVSGGKLTPVKVGTAKVTVTTKDGSFKATCTVKVEEPVKSIALSKTSLDIIEGAVYTLKANLLPANATNKTVTWSTSDASIAKVSGGVITAVKTGTATISAKTSNGIVAKCTVMVRKPVQSISVSQTELAMHTLKTAKLNATVLPSDAWDKTVKWTSSDEEIATVKDGLITAHKAGEVTITAISSNNLTASCVVTITDIPVESVTLSVSELEMNTNKTAQLVATVLPEDATFKNVVWTSDNEEIATVEDGLITAHKAGEVIITATSSNGLTAQCKVIITDIPAESVEMQETLSINKGEAVQLIATVLPDDTTDKSLTWQSDNEEVATVENGIVTALKDGTATITVATANGLTASCEITVTTKTQSVELSETTLSIKKGEIAKLEATVLPDDATDKTVTWETDNEKVAAVEDGVIKALEEGVATITVKTADGQSASCVVTVYDEIFTTGEIIEEVSTTGEIIEEISTTGEIIEQISTTGEIIEEVSTTGGFSDQISTTGEILSEVFTTIF